MSAYADNTASLTGPRTHFARLEEEVQAAPGPSHAPRAFLQAPHPADFGFEPPKQSVKPDGVSDSSHASAHRAKP